MHHLISEMNLFTVKTTPSSGEANTLHPQKFSTAQLNFSFSFPLIVYSQTMTHSFSIILNKWDHALPILIVHLFVSKQEYIMIILHSVYSFIGLKNCVQILSVT